MVKRVSIVGSGHLAWHLALGLEERGVAVAELYGRDEKKARQLAKRLYNAEVKTSLDFTKSTSGVFILAIADSALPQVAKTLAVPEGSLVAHTSGATAMSVLSPIWDCQTGVFYPLQTFTKGKSVNWKSVPICIEGNSSEAQETLAWLAELFSEEVYIIDSVQRKTLHVAAVFASNFVNHLLNIADTLLQEEEVSLDLLKPLITEQVQKSLSIGPGKAQTGPAVREDYTTIDLHKLYLEDYPRALEVYELLTQQIMDSIEQREDDYT